MTDTIYTLIMKSVVWQEKATKLLIFILISLIAVVSANSLLSPIVDPDFFWHLATGEWIVEHRALPTTDPFSYTTPRIMAEREQFLMTQYWLSQVLYALLYFSAGLNGIKVLSFALVAGILLFLYLCARGKTDAGIFLAVLFIGIYPLLESFPMERPQAFSFLFFAILLFLLRRQIEHGACARSASFSGIGSQPYLRIGPHSYFMPVIMLLWSNMHGGYLVGQVTIIVCLFAEGLKVLSPRSLGQPMEMRSYRGFGAVGILSILIALLNPGGYDAVKFVLSFPEYMSESIAEFRSPLTMLQIAFRFEVVVYLMLFVVAAVGVCTLMRREKRDVTQILLFAGFGYFSLTTIRYMPFFILWAIPFVSSFLSTASRRSLFRIFASLLSIGVFCYLLSVPREFQRLYNIRVFATGRWVDKYFPEKAIEFLKKNRIQGNMYNFYDWGGYIIWKLAPDKQVFIDGRGLYGYVYEQAQAINSGSLRPEIKGMPFYKGILESYGVTHVVLPVYDSSGRILTLTIRLINDRDWKPVFFSENSLIFVKDSPANYGVLYKLSIPRDYFIHDLLDVLDRKIASDTSNIYPHLAKAELLISQSRFAEAKEEFEAALRIYPINKTARTGLEELKKMGY